MAQEEKVLPERWREVYGSPLYIDPFEKDQLIEELGAAESKLERFRTPKVYEGPFYAVVEVPDMCPECDGKSWISHGSKGMCCHICFLIRDLDAAESALTTQADEMKRLKVDPAPEVTTQILVDVGVNAFAFELVSESLAGKIRNNPKAFKRLRFSYKGVVYTLEPVAALSPQEPQDGEKEVGK